MSLTATNLTVRLGTREIVRAATFEISTGELAFMIGPNGAGKTTALRAIAGLVAHTGAVQAGGQLLGALDAATRARAIAYVPQGHVAHWPLAARDVVAIGRRPHRSSLAALDDTDRDAIARALAAVDATAFADRPVTDLSGGERARVMLARALAVEAPVLLADEPVAALDPRHQLAVATLLRTLARGGRTVLAVGHDLALAARFADRIIVMHDGRIAANGPPRAVLTDSVLADVFGIEVARLAHAGEETLLPWSVSPAAATQ